MYTGLTLSWFTTCSPTKYPSLLDWQHWDCYSYHGQQNLYIQAAVPTMGGCSVPSFSPRLVAATAKLWLTYYRWFDQANLPEDCRDSLGQMFQWCCRETRTLLPYLETGFQSTFSRLCRKVQTVSGRTTFCAEGTETWIWTGLLRNFTHLCCKLPWVAEKTQVPNRKSHFSWVCRICSTICTIPPG